MRYTILHTPTGWLLFDNLFNVVARVCANEREARVLVEAFNEAM